MQFQPRLILFDVDGTMVDSVPDLADAVNVMQTKLGRDPHSEAKIRHWVGNGVEKLVKRALSDDLDAEPDAALFEQAVPHFRQAYSLRVCERSHLYDGVEKTLSELKDRGFNLGCITNKAEQFTLPLLQKLGIANYFSITVCGDTLSEKKPHPMPLLHCAKHFDVHPSEALMIGDSISDVKAARAAGFNIICLSYGYNHGQDIHTANPDAVIDSFNELPDYL